jgi:hypothetical protein
METSFVIHLYYKRLVRRLIYLVVTQSDIAHSINIPSQYMHQPRKSHINIVIKVVKYLR